MLRTYRTSELLRGIFVLRLCCYRKFVKNSEELMNFGRRILGQRAFKWLMKRTFYGQFVAGEDLASMRETVKRLNASKVSTMFYVPVEGDEGDSSEQHRSSLLDGNVELFLDGITEASKTTQHGMAQVKFTGVADIQLLLDMSREMRRSQLHPADDHQALVAASHDLGSIHHVPSAILDKHKDCAAQLTKRLHTLVEHGRQNNVMIIFDAEQTYFQPAIQRLILPIQLHYNKLCQSPLVYTTLQAYLKETGDVLDGCLSLFKEENVRFATKLVRGAYMQQEREKAAARGYESPIHESYDDTNKSYQQSLAKLLDGVGEDRVSVMVSTHNVASIQFAKKRMNAMGLANSDGHRVCFAQIYGLGDNMTSSLAEEGYRVYKSVPYGPVDTVLAYLSRRVQENNSVLDRVEQESAFLWDEVKRRVRS